MYKDNAVPPRWTIGYGHNIQDNGISRKAAEFILEEDLADAKRDSQRFTWFEAQDEVRQAVVVNMVFNMGLPTFRGFENTIRFLEMGMYVDAGEEILKGSGPGGKSKWYHDVGDRAVELSEMLKTGEWP